MNLDLVSNNPGRGSVAETLLNCNFDPNALRPWVGRDGRSYITRNVNGKPQAFVTNASATLRKDDWIYLDRAIIEAAKPRLRVVADLRAKGLEFNIPNGLGKTSLEHEAMSDIGDAMVSMDGLRKNDSSRPLFDLRSMPLPITHMDFQFSARQIAASRNSGSPLDTTSAELAGRRVAEMVEKLTLGEASSYSFGGGTIYGLKNFTHRLTKSLTAPTTSNQSTTLAEVLDMVKKSQDAGYFGPWALYYSPAWTSYMGGDYAANKGTDTLAQRLGRIDGIEFVRQADYLSGTTLILVQLTPEVIRMIIGMDITTVQWESEGGMQLNFKVLAIMVPQLRQDFNSATGIVHGSV